MKSSHDIAKTLSALAHPHRVDILKLLLSHLPEPLSTGTVAGRTGLAASTLAHHLREMETGGVIARTPKGRATLITCNVGQLTAIVATLTQLCCSAQSSQQESPTQ